MADLQSIRYGFRGAISRYFEVPASTFLAKIGFTPNRATVVGLVIAAAGAYFAAIGTFWLAGILVGIAAVFDLLDGGIARRTGTVSKRGALLDSVADRVSEGVVLFGLLIYFTRPATADQTMAILAFVAFAGSVMVSYVRARAEGLGYKGTAGFLTRPERVVIMVVLLVVSQPGWALWILAIGTPLSALWRFWAEWRGAGQDQ